MIKRNCFTCGEEFFTKPSILKNGDGKFCSKECYHKSWIGKHHSKETIGKFKKRIGEKSPSWKGGRIKEHGYILIYSLKHPFKNYKNRVYEHRLVVEKIIGRYLLPTEEVHHLRARDDNRPQMLMAFINHSAHNRFERNCFIKSNEIIFDGRKI